MRGVRCDRSQMFALLRSGKRTRKELSEKLGVSESVVFAMLKERKDQIQREKIPRGKGQGSGAASLVYWMEPSQ